MKFSETWLREMVNPPVSREQLAERLTMSGLEVESMAAVAAPFSGICVAAIAELRPHPDAGRLHICDADIGNGERLQIVTGAANVHDGMRVPLARIGAVLPGDKRIVRSKLRGVESDGMLCSAVELGLSTTADGVLALPDDAPIGMDLREYLRLDDASIELNVTPNRGDCLSVFGIAREVGAEFGISAQGPAIRTVPATVDDRLPVDVPVPADCPRYVGRIVRGINPNACTPVWMTERLRRSGLRSLHPVVDITNYVLLELGQPMHAFDLHRLQGGIRVRRAQQGETLRLLDGQTVELSTETLVIADHRCAIAMAGIMGGADTAVTADTVDIFLESAFFSPATIAGRARQYKLQTDSSYRFERGVDYSLQAAAMERASGLVLEICGGRAGPIIEALSAAHLPQRPALSLRRARLQRVLCFAPEDREISAALRGLGMDVEDTAEGWRVVPPVPRYDIELEADLVEEVVRIAGYDRVPARMPAGEIRMFKVPEGGTSLLTRVREVLVQRGYAEAMTYSFVSHEADKRVRPDAEAMILANPISRDMAVMRTSLWPGLINALAYNQSRQQERVRLFEIGKCFEKKADNILQINMISGIVSGDSWPEQWTGGRRAVDFFDVRGDVEAILGVLAPRQAYEVRIVQDTALHPGQSAEFVAGNSRIAKIGAMNIDLIRDFSLRGEVFAFEIEIDQADAVTIPRYAPLSKFPSVRRDLSIVVDRALPVSEVMSLVRKSAPETLRHLQLFDVYESEGIDSGKKSIALGLIFQGTSSTLLDDDIDAQVAAIVDQLARRLGAVLRDS